MENIVIPILLTVVVIRALMLPVRWGWKVLIHSLGGFACLWMLNLAGMGLPMNPVTVAVAGILGVPGIALIALLGFV